MGSKIPYITEQWSVVTGCSGKGCKAHCWAKEMVKRFPQIHRTWPAGYGIDGFDYEPIPFSTVQFHPDRLNKPLHWRNPRRVGVCFTGDLFDKQVPFDWIGEVCAIMRRCPQHQFFVLTKQPKNMIGWYEFTKRLVEYPILKNLYTGVSICDQDDANRMIPELLRVPGKHWISIEPQLSEIDVEPWIRPPGTAWKSPIDWVVLGSESGPNRRPCPPGWMVDVVRQCRESGVPVYVKQVNIGGKVGHDITKFPKELQIQEFQK